MRNIICEVRHEVGLLMYHPLQPLNGMHTTVYSIATAWIVVNFDACFNLLICNLILLSRINSNVVIQYKTKWPIAGAHLTCINEYNDLITYTNKLKLLYSKCLQVFFSVVRIHGSLWHYWKKVWETLLNSKKIKVFSNITPKC